MTDGKDFLKHGGEMGAQVREHVWANSSLGPLATWPPALCNALRFMLGSPESMYLVWGPDLTFFYNDAYRPILGPRIDRALGEPLPILWADAWPAVKEPLNKALAGEASRFIDVPISMARYGVEEQTNWTYSYSPLYDDDTIAGVLCYTTETTAQVIEELAHIASLKETGEQLRQSQKMEAVGQLTGGLAHDFNNLLTGILGALDLIDIRINQGRLKDIEKYMVAAKGATRRAAALTHRLLAFSRRQTLDPKPTDVNRLISGMLEMIQRTVGPAIRVNHISAADSWPIFVDAPQLENALLNLCINARDAMPEGGKIIIEVSNRQIDETTAIQHDLPAGEYMSLCVSDTGIGMSPDTIARAFEPFFTTKPIGQGTGLGLSMIFGFAEQSGGRVKITSEVHKGTTVCVYLPRYLGDVEADSLSIDQAVLTVATVGETVLIVDDDDTVRMLVADVLEDMGYTAIEAADSLSGLKMLQSDVRIDLLISDVGLPGGLNGRQMADAARLVRPDLKVLFITGYAATALVSNGQLETGMAVLTKPFHLEVLSARIREVMSETMQ